MPDKTIRTFTDLSLIRVPNWPLDEKVVQRLMEDIRLRLARGEPPQITPILVAPCGDDPKLFELGDGLHRLTALKRLNLPVEAEVRPEPFKPGEVNRIRAGSLINRKRVNPFELDEIMTRHRRDLKFATWKEAAADLGIPASTLSSITCVKRIPEDLRPKVEPLGPTVVRSIARLKTRADMERAIDFAVGTDGKPLPKDKVELFIKQEIKQEKPGKEKKVTFTVGQRKIVLYVLKGDKALQASEAARSLADRLKKFPETPPEGWVYIPA